MYMYLCSLTKAHVDMRNSQYKLHEAGFGAMRTGYQDNKKRKKDSGFSSMTKIGPLFRKGSDWTIVSTSHHDEIAFGGFSQIHRKSFYLVATKIREREADFGLIAFFFSREEDALAGNIADNNLVVCCAVTMDCKKGL